jgi:purine-cytosine permease-like protein
LTPTQATYFVGVFGFIGAALAPVVSGNMTRRVSFMYAQGSMGLAMIIIAILKIK